MDDTSQVGSFGVWILKITRWNKILHPQALSHNCKSLRPQTSLLSIAPFFKFPPLRNMCQCRLTHQRLGHLNTPPCWRIWFRGDESHWRRKAEMTTIDGKCHRYSSVCFNANISAAKLHIWLIGVLAHNISALAGFRKRCQRKQLLRISWMGQSVYSILSTVWLVGMSWHTHKHTSYADSHWYPLIGWQKETPFFTHTVWIYARNYSNFQFCSYMCCIVLCKNSAAKQRHRKISSSSTIDLISIFKVVAVSRTAWSAWLAKEKTSRARWIARSSPPVCCLSCLPMKTCQSSRSILNYTHRIVIWCHISLVYRTARQLSTQQRAFRASSRAALVL